MKIPIFFLCLLAIACQSAKGIRRAKQLQNDGYLKTTATTVQMARCCHNDSVRIHYIGCGGYLIRRGDDAVLIDPYFSNAPIKSLGCLKTDSALIARFFYENFNNLLDLPSKNAQNAKNTEGPLDAQNAHLPSLNVIKAVLVAHAHHDHLADLPYIYQHHLSSPRTVLLSSETASNILQSFKTPFDPPSAFFNLDSIFKQKRLKNDTFSVRWTTQNHRLRITAIESEHAPHFLGLMKIPFIGGKVRRVPKHAPRSTFGFKEGKNYNYLIDFLGENGSVAFRIYAGGSAASSPKVGLLPPSVLNEKTVDLMILCGANYDQAKDYPQSLLKNVQPERVLVGHWEDFFTPIPTLLQTPQTVRFTNIPRFLSILQAEMRKNGNNNAPIMLQPQTPLTVRF